MAAQLPDNLRVPEIQRFAKRAAQLEKFRPIVTYWCEYYILQQILSKQLHAADEECSNYAIQLMDKLEGVKAQNAGNDAITDDVAAKAYIENFALETFNRADEAQRQNKVTVQTADTFQAASTFMDLLSIWGVLDREMATKSKFAKFHAMRIIKAIRAGEDPNASNPVVEQPPVPVDVGIEEELKALENGQPEGTVDEYRAPTVEAVPDDGIASGIETTSQGPPTIDASVPSASAGAPPNAVVDLSSPQQSTPAVARQGSLGGGYFPTIPSAPATLDTDMASDEATEPTAPPTMISPHLQDNFNPQDFYNTNASPPPTTFEPDRPHRPTPSQMAAQPPTIEPIRHEPSPLPAPIMPPPAQVQQNPSSLVYNTDDESTLAAQKHAKWAISALNFEDVNTAVKELRLALQSLGAA